MQWAFKKDDVGVIDPRSELKTPEIMDVIKKLGGKSKEKERQDISSERLANSRHKYERNWRASPSRIGTSRNLGS
jgi:hypothetical protein